MKVRYGRRGKFPLVAWVCIFLCCRCCAGAEPSLRLCEPWESEYSGDDAGGKHVIALWQFTAGSEMTDSSGHGHDLKLAGAAIGPDGRFGSCLESFCGWPIEDKKHAAIADNHPDLTPKGPFTVEMWIKPKPELKEYPDSFLLDKKYSDETDYQLILARPSKRSEICCLRMNLGFGADSAFYYSTTSEYQPGVWYHIAFTYDGEGGGAFYVNGMPMGATVHPGKKSISPGKKPLSIGDRIGSLYHGFPGFIDQVRISDGVLEFCPARFAFLSERTSFVRMEKGQSLRFGLTNLLRAPLSGAVARFSVGGLLEKEIQLPPVDSGKTQEIDYPLDTSLRPDTYQVNAELAIGGDKPYKGEQSFPIAIVPRPLPHRMPVAMWGVYGTESVRKEMGRLKEIGFTHCLGLPADFGKIWNAGKPTEAQEPDRAAAAKQMLNAALANDLGIVSGLSPGSWARGKKEFQRIDRDGKPYGGKDKDKGDVCGRFPEVKDFCYNVGASVAQTYGAFPAFQAAIIHSEVRGHSQPCFHEHDREAFRTHAGFDIPEEAKSTRGVEYQKLEGFPADRVIPDDHPILVYYKWFWKVGDGWNDLHTAVHKGIKSTGREDIWTFHDPAVRVPSIYGSGGEVDILSQWTYSYPDPIRIACATDELLAMAKGAATDQQVMKMTQIIWYRSQTAPQSSSSTAEADRQSVWEDTDPDAAFITIAPMHLREAFWTKISRPIRGIMYHGWQSLVDVDKPGGYRYTNPQTRHELNHLIKNVVEPIGPTLLQVPDVKADVAFLESFASQMFARRGTYGWNGGWEGDAYHILQYAQLQPEIVYDETVIEKGLDGFRVLFMMDCDVITRSVVERVKEFQAKGGLVVGDERLAPAIQPDILLSVYERTKRADEDKAVLLARAVQLRKELDSHYSRYLDSSNPEVVTHRRRCGETDYVFAINDHREYGDYVGQYGLLMENGLPSDTALTVNRDSGFVYDLVNHEQVPGTIEGGKLLIKARLGPCEGRLFMISPSEIRAVRIGGPERVARGSEGAFTIEVVDDGGRPVDAVVPIRVDILDAEGRPAEFSGFYGAAGGKIEIRADIAVNDSRGMWQINVRELASGLSAVHYFRVQDLEERKAKQE